MKPREANQNRMEQWGERIREQKQSGRSIKAWCTAQGVNREQYYYWQRKIRSAVCEEIGTERGETGTGLSRTRFVEVKIEQPEKIQPKAGILQIEARGIRITTDSVYPVEKLTELLLGVTQA